MTLEAPWGALLVVAGAFFGGLVNGLTGFGTGMTALPFWVHALPPLLASPLVVACSIVSQLQTLPAIWHAIDFRRLWPFVLGGVVGVPIGVTLLPHIEANVFKTAIGVVLILACSVLLWTRSSRKAWPGGGRAADGSVGFAGGILGGLAGMSGTLPTLWAELRGWEKDARRAVFQGYNISILVVALVSQAIAGFLTREFALILLMAVPGTILGAWIGRRLYGRLDTYRFSTFVLVLLLAAGFILIASGLRS